MQKLMSFDLDGTLVFNREIEEANIGAIRKWQDAGHIAVCNTGKSIFATKVALKPYDVAFDYFVLYTGAVICDRDFNILEKKTLPLSIVQKVYKRLSAMDNVAVFATTLDQDFELVNRVGGVSNILPAFESLNPQYIPHHEYVGVPIWSPDPNVRAEIFAWILDEFGSELDCHRNLDFLDIVPKNSTKGSGLEMLLEQQFAHNRPEVFTIGDSWNDLEMHRMADHAASFSYSPADVRAATEHVVEKTFEFIDRVLLDEQ